MKPALTNFIGIIVLGIVFAATEHCSPRKPAPSPEAALDAGSRVVGTLCQFLEGITENDTLVTVCATAEEVLLIAQILAPLLASSSDAGSNERCTRLPETEVCATKHQLGKAIPIVLEKRRAFFMLDASVP